MQKLATSQELQQRIRTVLATVERDFRPLTDDQMRWKPASDSWSITECLQHLNLAEQFYIRQLQHHVGRIGVQQVAPTDQTLESDFVGRTLRWIIDPQTTLKFPAPGVIRPRRASDLDVANVLRQFVELQTLLLTLLDKAVYLDWNGQKVPTLFGSWLKIKLGDVMLMLVAHTERHINQAGRVKNGL
ncbi:MAG: DinB family protein [Bacteroidetes bacterium]|nr:DinB family protein [Fibrella sp.]